MTKNSSRSPRNSTQKTRPAAQADLPAIAALQIRSWQTAYRGLVPDAYLADQVPGLLQAHWARMPGPDWRIETAWRNETLLGFVALDLAHDGGPYVDNLHVAPEAHGAGIGRALMACAAGHALPHGTVWLTVLDGNAPARAFYEKLGGTLGAPEPDEMAGLTVTARALTWTGAALSQLASTF